MEDILYKTSVINTLKPLNGKMYFVNLQSTSKAVPTVWNLFDVPINNDQIQWDHFCRCRDTKFGTLGSLLFDFDENLFYFLFL